MNQPNKVALAPFARPNNGTIFLSPGTAMALLSMAKTLPDGHQRPSALSCPRVEKSKNIISCPGVEKSEESAIIDLYYALVPEDLGKPIDIGLIKNEGFPAFENTIGKERFQKLKSYFGIGCSPNKGIMTKSQKNKMIDSLRTIENAQYYLYGYKQLLEDVALRLDGAPESMGTLERAKFVFMHITLFCNYGFFLQDYNGKNLDYQKAFDNNLKPFTPELLFDMYELMVKQFGPKTIFYEQITFELTRIEKDLRDRALLFAELQAHRDEKCGFISVNKKGPYPSFYEVRGLKNCIHHEVGSFPIETFSCKPRLIEALSIERLYTIYCLLKGNPKSLPVGHQKLPLLVGSSICDVPHSFYDLGPLGCIGITTEAERFKNLMNFVAKKGIELNSSAGTPVNAGLLCAAIKFASECQLLEPEINADLDLRIAAAIMARDASGALQDYKNSNITAEELKTRLRINDDDLSQEIKAIKKDLGLLSLEDVVINFAVENGYAASESAVSKALVQNAILHGNEHAFEEYAKGHIDSETLKKQISFQEKFATMYFVLSSVQIDTIQSHLIDLRGSSSKAGDRQDSKLVAALYCYLVENQVACGPKNVAPKKMRQLNPDNIRFIYGLPAAKANPVHS